MGIIRAFTGALGGTLADQWKDIIQPTAFDEYTVVNPGVNRGTNNGRGTNYKGSEGVITNGSMIYVPENTAAFIFSQQGVEDIITCEMCGSPELVKEGDYFECKHCGCKYSVEEIKRQMGIVTVQINEDNKGTAIRKKADDEYESGDYKSARSTYNSLLEINPNECFAIYRMGICEGYTSNSYNTSRIKLINYCERALQNVPDEDKEKLLSSMSVEALDLLRAIYLTCSSEISGDASERRSSDAAALFSTMNYIDDLCDFLCNKVVNQKYWYLPNVPQYYLLVCTIKKENLLMKGKDVKYADTYTSDSFGIHYNYETYGLTSEGRAANLRKIKEANERLDAVEEFTAMKAKVQNNNFEAEIAILEDELRAGLKEVVDKEKELAVQEKNSRKQKGPGRCKG